MELSWARYFGLKICTLLITHMSVICAHCIHVEDLGGFSKNDIHS